jgi:NADPH:quinone reductase-like Zn-dependent oxidoreductase
MKAIVYDRYGSPEVLRLQDVPMPVPQDDEIRTRIQACSVNRSDWEGLTGRPLYARIGGLRRPRRHILGSDIAGKVEQAGASHALFKPGDEVFGDILSRLGGFAEYVCVRGNTLALKPRDLTFEQASALPQAGLIALQGIRDKGQVQPGQQVLINGAGGGAGAYAVQLAKLHGAEVTGVDNAGKQDFMRSFGADHVLDYARTDFTRNGQRYDCILDVVAYRSPLAVTRALKPGGRYYAVGGSAAILLQIALLAPWIRRRAGKHVGVLIMRTNRKDLEHIADLCVQGKLDPVIDRRYALSEVPAALGALGAGKAHGKIVITVRDTA